MKKILEIKQKIKEMFKEKNIDFDLVNLKELDSEISAAIRENRLDDIFICLNDDNDYKLAYNNCKYIFCNFIYDFVNNKLYEESEEDNNYTCGEYPLRNIKEL